MAVTWKSIAYKTDIPVSANPSVLIGMSVNNGAAATFMRSDATPAIDPAIAPVWTGAHTFTGQPLTVRGDGGSQAFVNILYVTDAVQAPTFTGLRARGSLASPTGVQAGDPLARFSGRGYYNTTTFPGSATGRVDIVATETWSATAYGTRIEVYTTPAGTTTPALAATFGSDQSLTIAGTTDSTIFSTGALVIAGGLGVAKSAFFGSTVTIGYTPRSGVFAPQLSLLQANDRSIPATMESSVTQFAGGQRQWGDGTVAVQREYLFTPGAYEKTTTSATFTDAATVAILNAPSGLTGVTITRKHALWVQAGQTTLAGGLSVGTYTAVTAGQVAVSGSLGIGASPTMHLDVNGVDGVVSYITTRLSGAASGYGSFIQFTDGVTYNYSFGTNTNGDFAWWAGRYGGNAGTQEMLLTQAGALTVLGGFGVNAAAAQAKYASGGAVAPGAGAFGASSAVNFAALVTLVSNMRTALVNNGIMS